MANEAEVGEFLAADATRVRGAHAELDPVLLHAVLGGVLSFRVRFAAFGARELEPVNCGHGKTGTQITDVEVQQDNKRDEDEAMVCIDRSRYPIA